MTCAYTGELEIIDQAGEITRNLMGRVNKGGMISPRADVQLKGLESGRIICSHPISSFHCISNPSWLA
ncbi:hypothetical protein LEMLEM_LOCUS7025 [Lemmus lemmus]